VNIDWISRGILQHVADVSDSAEAAGCVASNDSEVSQLSDGCFLTPLCHKFVYISLLSGIVLAFHG